MLHGDGTKYGQVISGLFLQKAQAENKSDDRFWKTDRNLYRELFSSTPNPNGIVSIWSSPLKQENLINALQYGYQYSREEILAEYGKYHLHPHVWQVPSNPSDRIEVAEDWCRKTGLGAMVYFGYWQENCAAIYDDAAADRLFAGLERYLKKHEGAVMGVHLGDECFCIYETAFIRRACSKDPKQRKRAASPAFQQALRTIREQYGYGKFGIPSSPTADNEPFNWIAMRKFILARMLKFQQKLFEITRKYRQADGRPLICQTPTGREQMHLLQPERFAQWCDIVALQSNPARMHQHAFMAKFMTDLSLGKPVSAVDHMENLYGSFGPEKTAAGLSQLARGGVTGLIRWGADHINGKRGKNSSIFCRYGHPARWNTLNDISLKFHEMPLLKFPKPDYAVLLSQDTFLSQRSNTLPDDEAFFGLVGPAAGSWFKYISDIGLMDGKVRLEDWKTVVIVKGTIMDPKIAAALENYLNNGGSIICFDPEVASFSPDGNSTRQWADRIFGVSRTAASGVVCYRIHPDLKWFPDSSFKNGLPTYGVSKYMLRPEPGTEILARFENGKAAATMKVYPQGGRAILCTLPPGFAMSENPEWIRFALSVLRQSGISVKHNIWNFNFPFEPEKRPVFDSVCLTGNHFYWWRNQPVKEPNVQLKNAFYTLSSAPDHLKGSSPSLKFAFENGNLTNRLSAFEAGDLYNRRNAQLVKSGKLKLSQFADTWSDPDSLKIRFQFPKKVNIRRIRLFYQGSLPPFVVKTAVGTVKNPERTTDQVMCQEVSLSGGSTDFLEIIFGRNTKPGKLTLSEIEIWGE